jgi:hypothetical protein
VESNPCFSQTFGFYFAGFRSTGADRQASEKSVFQAGGKKKKDFLRQIFEPGSFHKKEYVW